VAVAEALPCFGWRRKKHEVGQVDHLGRTEVAGPSWSCGPKGRRCPSTGERRWASLDREVGRPKAKAEGGKAAC
jgi:hypothetical protein